MKKALIITGIIIFLIIVYIFSFGIQVGNVRIGKQEDLKTEQIYDFKSSPFYKKYYSQEKLSVINFWATWCGPCIAEMPELNTIKEKYKNAPVNFLSFSVDKDSVKFVDFLKKGRFKFDDVTLENLAYRNTIVNVSFGKPENAKITSFAIPLTILVKNDSILERIQGSVETEELVILIKKHL